MRRYLLLAALLLSPASTTHAETPAEQAARPGMPVENLLSMQIDAILDGAPKGTRIGMVVEALDGRMIYSRAADQRFIPASNTKIFVTAAAFARLDILQANARGAEVFLHSDEDGRNTVTLTGYGDPALSSASDCTEYCLSTLADAITAKAKVVDDIIGDDRFFADERWSSGMSWNNIPYRWGAAISALSINDNLVSIIVSPPPEGCPIANKPPLVTSPCRPVMDEWNYYKITNDALMHTVREGNEIAATRLPGDFQVKVHGDMALRSDPVTLRMAVDDPANYAASLLRKMLVEREVEITGEVRTRNQPVAPPIVDAGEPGMQPEERQPLLIGKLPASSIRDDITTINKQSHNLRAELLLRRLGALQGGGGSVEKGQAVIRSSLGGNHSFSLSDGSGMSTYNRVTPGGMVKLLRWITTQKWGNDWRNSLPVGGVDGTLRKRFVDTPLKGRVFAKTGSLNGTRALSGYVETASGEVLAFSIFANDIPDDEAAKAVEVMDQALLKVAAVN